MPQMLSFEGVCNWHADCLGVLRIISVFNKALLWGKTHSDWLGLAPEWVDLAPKWVGLCPLMAVPLPSHVKPVDWGLMN